MRSDAVTMCAMGAMLFGGTLGVANQAEAGLVWTDVGSGSSYVSIRDTSEVDGSTFRDYTASDTSSPFVTALNGTSVTFSSLTANGFSISAVKPQNYWVDICTTFTFSVSSATTVSISGIGFGNGNWFMLYDPSFNQIWNGNAGPGTGTEVRGAYSSGQITLQAGTYVLSGGTSIDEGPTFGSSQTIFSLTVVPAPGAVALLGAAGLVSGRRRKA